MKHPEEHSAVHGPFFVSGGIKPISIWRSLSSDPLLLIAHFKMVNCDVAETMKGCLSGAESKER